MIAASNCTRQEAREPGESSPWQRELSRALTDPRELLELLGLDDRLLAPARAAGGSFRMLVPRGFARRMRHGDPADPLLRQVLPVAEELDERPGFCSDPLGEAAHALVPGLLHKYHGRALLVTTGACAVHCRYCFRREFPYAPQGRFQSALSALASDPSIAELILSGGDPLLLATSRLAELTEQLRAIPHLRRLRLHTRTPIVLPERVDAPLERWMAGLPWPFVVVLHANHANEIDDAVRSACARLAASGAVLLNQSVLLAGVNDSAAALAGLSEALWSARVLPYYLHLLDRVRGAAHFEVPDPRARTLMAELAARLPGYLVPRLVRESPGAPAKSIIAPSAWAPAPPTALPEPA